MYVCSQALLFLVKFLPFLNYLFQFLGKLILQHILVEFHGFDLAFCIEIEFI